MGLLSWMTGSMDRSLDQQVQAGGGVAHHVYQGLLQDEPLGVKASVTRGHTGELELMVNAVPDTDQPPPPQHERGSNRIECRLQEGGKYRHAELAISGEIKKASEDPVAGLQVELWTDQGGTRLNLQTFSVESRFDPDGRATLRLLVRFT